MATGNTHIVQANVGNLVHCVPKK